MVKVDHGNQLVTRYAYASRTLVKPGDLVRRGEKIAEVGTNGRPTGGHLHFEALVQGVFQTRRSFCVREVLRPVGLLQPRQRRPRPLWLELCWQAGKIAGPESVAR
ncbi:Peptidase M23 [Acidovorax delafieldii 2AN]|uniref:Peptidase M23 n=1 Tax=Acidovorax delafieldii 2AN TaxID=573060 RepID=C5T2G4_ACIDE|nr:Peptidase M23 [Acidovorax delafieldii 2AN]